jgi:intracellular septation protein
MWIRASSIAFLPLVTFFVVTIFFDFFIGIGAMIGATALSIFLSLWYTRTLPWFGLFTFGVAITFGSASIVFKNTDIFIVSDTVSNIGIALALLITLKNKRPLLKIFFDDTFAISDRAWRILTFRWALFFIILAVGNEGIRFWYDEKVWLWYRALSVVATVLFGLYQFRLARNERVRGESNAWGLRISPRNAPLKDTAR